MQINKVSNIQSQNNSKPMKNNDQVGFKGAFVPTEGYTAVLDYLATNPVWGATAVDVGSMGTPRFIVDTCNRGWGAGGETAFINIYVIMLKIFAVSTLKVQKLMKRVL